MPITFDEFVEALNNPSYSAGTFCFFEDKVCFIKMIEEENVTFLVCDNKLAQKTLPLERFFPMPVSNAQLLLAARQVVAGYAAAENFIVRALVIDLPLREALQEKD